jgi:hypothetical protein
MHANSESFQTDVSDRERDERKHKVMVSVKVSGIVSENVIGGVERGVSRSVDCSRSGRFVNS